MSTESDENPVMAIPVGIVAKSVDMPTLIKPRALVFRSAFLI
jgi:hypothetical protein